jgi:hypothetical protein
VTTTAHTDRNLTDLRPKKRDRRAEADRHRMTRSPLHRRIVGMMRRSGFTPEAWQVESLAATFTANKVTPTDEELTRGLMAAPWYPKPRVRRWRVGETGWRTRS